MLLSSTHGWGKALGNMLCRSAVFFLQSSGGRIRRLPCVVQRYLRYNSGMCVYMFYVLPICRSVVLSFLLLRQNVFRWGRGGRLLPKMLVHRALGITCLLVSSERPPSL
jgi:hypothetical protein